MEIFSGTYTINPGFVKGSLNIGIPRYRFSSTTGLLQKENVLTHPGNPSFMALSPDRKSLFSVSEVGQYSGQPEGGLLCHKQNAKNKSWTIIAEVETGGAYPCHVAIDPKGKFVFVTNYAGGSVGMFDFSEGNGLSRCHLEQHTGRSVDPERQTSPHPHSSLPDPSGEFLFVADLGLDQVRIYQIDRKNKRLYPHVPASIALPPGSGPRHMVLHSNAGRLYVLNELTASLSVFECRYPFERVEPVAILKTLPEAYAGPPSAAEIALHPNGKFLYVSNRGHDSITLLKIDRGNGLPKAEATYNTGRTPRHFAISPDGKWLVSAHQDDGTLQVWSIAPSTGRLEQSGPPVVEPAVVYVLFH
jgi:6-phosphogluconolactonase